MLISKDTQILEVLQTKPQSKDIFIKYGMHCVNCLGSEFETIETCAQTLEIDLTLLLKELNELA